MIHVDGLADTSHDKQVTLSAEFLGWIKNAQKSYASERGSRSSHMEWVSKIDSIQSEDTAEEKNEAHQGKRNEPNNFFLPCLALISFFACCFVKITKSCTSLSTSGSTLATSPFLLL